MTSGTCISTTRDPATERIQNCLFCVVWSPASKSFQHSFLVPFTFTLPQLPRYSLTNCCRHEQQFPVAQLVEQRADDQQQQQRQRKKTQNKTKKQQQQQQQQQEQQTRGSIRAEFGDFFLCIARSPISLLGLTVSGKFMVHFSIVNFLIHRWERKMGKFIPSVDF